MNGPTRAGSSGRITKSGSGIGMVSPIARPRTRSAGSKPGDSKAERRGGSAGPPRAREGREAPRGRSLSQRSARHSPSPVGKGSRRANSPGGGSGQGLLSPRDTRRWASRDPISAGVLESTGTSRRLYQDIQPTKNTPSIKRASSREQPHHTQRSRVTASGLSMRYGLTDGRGEKTLNVALRKNGKLSQQIPDCDNNKTNSGTHSAPGVDYKSTNEAAIRVMQRVRRLMNVLEGSQFSPSQPIAGEDKTKSDIKPATPPKLKGDSPVKQSPSARPASLTGSKVALSSVPLPSMLSSAPGTPDHTDPNFFIKGKYTDLPGNLPVASSRSESPILVKSGGGHGNRNHYLKDTTVAIMKKYESKTTRRSASNRVSMGYHTELLYSHQNRQPPPPPPDEPTKTSHHISQSTNAHKNITESPVVERRVDVPSPLVEPKRLNFETKQLDTPDHQTPSPQHVSESVIRQDATPHQVCNYLLLFWCFCNLGEKK